MTVKTVTEKRFFEWHEDDVAVTLRNKGGSYGGGSKVLVICSTKTQSEHYAKTSMDDQQKILSAPRERERVWLIRTLW